MRARRGWGWPLVPVYAAGLAVKDGLRRVGILRTRRLVWPVVSVGSLSAGGAGKTPVVIALVELLKARGWHVDVLSRGYGRSGRGVELVDVGMEGAAGRFGDEPVVVGKRAGVRVWVGGDRYAAGVMAEGWGVAKEETGSSASLRNGSEEKRQQREHVPGAKAHIDSVPVMSGIKSRPILDTVSTAIGHAKTSGRGVHLLDDGFQHRGLGRAVDVVLVTAEDLEDAMLPAGNRREPLRALRRADVVVVREEERAGVEGRVRRWMRRDAAVWSVRRRLRFGGAEELDAGLNLSTDAGVHTPGAKAPLSYEWGERPEAEASGYLEARAEAEAKAEARAEPEAKADTEAGPEAKPMAGAGGRVVGFCAIARPEGFWGMLAAAGCDVVGRVEFGDHHRCGMADVERLVKVAGERGATEFITTEKDAVKLSAAMMERLEAVGPVVIARLDVTFLDEAAVVRDLEGWLG